MIGNIFSDRLIILIIIISLIIRLFFLHPTFSDENFYINVGKIVLEGKILYKDFFFAHPPLQVYTLASLFGIFGVSFFVGKLLTLVTSSMCILLIYFISKEIYDEKSAFTASIIFVLTPAFLAFSTIGYGMWETVFFVLLSIYLSLKDKPSLAGIIFVFAVFFRYLALLYLPLIFLLIFIRHISFRKFIVSFFPLFIISFLSMFAIFGWNYFNQTIIFHISTKVVNDMMKPVWQYWGIGFFTIFLSLLSAFIGYTKKDKIILLFSIYPLIADLFIFFGLKIIFYHYFLISIPFFGIAAGRSFIACENRIMQIFIPILLLISIFSNITTIDFYLNPVYSERFHQITELITNKTSEEDAIFGEPIMTNYVSFVTGRKISQDYFDSFMQHLIFDGDEKVVKKLIENPPKIFIESNDYYSENHYFNSFIKKNYKLEENIPGIPNYSIYSRI